MNMITVSSKGEHSMAMGIKVDGEDTLSNEDTPSDNVGMPVQVVRSGIYSGRSVAHQSYKTGIGDQRATYPTVYI